MLSFCCWFRGFCHRTESDHFLFLFFAISTIFLEKFKNKNVQYSNSIVTYCRTKQSFSGKSDSWRTLPVCTSGMQRIFVFMNQNDPITQPANITVGQWGWEIGVDILPSCSSAWRECAACSLHCMCDTKTLITEGKDSLIAPIFHSERFFNCKIVTGCNPNDLDIWTDWCRLGLQFVVYKSAEQEWSFVN